MCRWFDSAPGHQTRKPLILNGLKGYFVPDVALAPWFGTPSRYTVASSTRRIGVSKTTRQRSFMAQPVKLMSGLYQLRRKVPLDLRQALVHEYKRSLKTRDPAEATIKFAEG